MTIDEGLWLVALLGLVLLALRWLLAWGLSPLSRQTVRQLFIDWLISTGDNVTVLTEGDEQFTVQCGAQICTISLDALYHRCLEFPYRTLLYVRQAVQALQTALDEGEQLPSDWEQQVVPQLVRTEMPAPPGLVTRPFVPGLAVGYALNGTENFRWLTAVDLERQQVTEAQLHALAARNLERSCNTLVIESPPPLPDGRDRLVSFQTADGLDAARVLIPSFYQRFAPRFGDGDLLVAIPTRDTLVMIATPDQGQSAFLAWRAEAEYARHAHPLLAQLLRITERGIDLWPVTGATKQPTG